MKVSFKKLDHGTYAALEMSWADICDNNLYACFSRNNINQPVLLKKGAFFNYVGNYIITEFQDKYKVFANVNQRQPQYEIIGDAEKFIVVYAMIPEHELTTVKDRIKQVSKEAPFGLQKDNVWTPTHETTVGKKGPAKKESSYQNVRMAGDEENLKQRLDTHERLHQEARKRHEDTKLHEDKYKRQVELSKDLLVNQVKEPVKDPSYYEGLRNKLSSAQSSQQLRMSAGNVSIPEDQLLQELEANFPSAQWREYNGRIAIMEDGSGSNGRASDGKPLWTPYPPGDNYSDYPDASTHKELFNFLDQRGWYVETVNSEVACLYPIYRTAPKEASSSQQNVRLSAEEETNVGTLVIDALAGKTITFGTENNMEVGTMKNPSSFVIEKTTTKQEGNSIELGLYSHAWGSGHKITVPIASLAELIKLGEATFLLGNGAKAVIRLVYKEAASGSEVRAAYIDVVKLLGDWHGGGGSAVYKLQSQLSNGYHVSKYDIEQAISELEEELNKPNGTYSPDAWDELSMLISALRDMLPEVSDDPTGEQDHILA